jgi:hypothetical protein
LFIRYYPRYTVQEALAEKAITFFTLLSEAHKLTVYDKRFALNAAKFPHLDQEGQNELESKLELPDDIVNDMLMVETDAETMREAFGGM